MKEIWTLDDKGKWGLALRNEAERRGWRTRVVKDIEYPGNRDVLFFARVAQNINDREKEMPIVNAAYAHGAQMIPDMELLREYESKILQYFRYKNWMPKTIYLTTAGDAEREVGALGYPFISKSDTGSASRNVRMIHNRQQAMAEIKAAFSDSGLAAPHGLGERTQRGYLLWQKFLSGNDYDYRACIIGDRVMLLRRGNRPEVPFASGSGFTEPIATLDPETRSVLEFAFQFFGEFSMEWSGIDIVRDHASGEWKMLETTIGWKQSAYAECSFYDRHGEPTGEYGSDVWKVFCDYIRRYI